MEFKLPEAVEILSQTPETLASMLGSLSPIWTMSSGDPDDWAPYDVLGHLIHGDETDWIVRAEIILGQLGDRRFEPFDRTAQFRQQKGPPVGLLLERFKNIRRKNLERLAEWEIDVRALKLTAIHPDFGDVTLEQLLSAWAVHDLTHVRQIVTFMARKYDKTVGPWKEFLSILR